MQIRKKIAKGQFKFPDCPYVIIDTDAGGDDAQAILYAISQAKKRNKTILGITCINGNASIENVAINVSITVTLAQTKIPIYKGAPANITCNDYKDHYFGLDGFGGKQQEYVDMLKDQNNWPEGLIHEQNAIEFLVESANKYPGKIAIVALGPLTNLALAYHLDNSFPQKIPMLSLMGGSTSAFGIRQFFAAQFNFHLDAEAAFVTMEVFPLIVVSSFDLSLDLGTSKTINLFNQKDRVKGKLIHDIHGQILATHRPSVCDPLACIPVFSPQIAQSIYQAYGRIEVNGDRTSGLLMLDWLSDKIEGRSKIWLIADIDLQLLKEQIDSSYC